MRIPMSHAVFALVCYLKPATIIVGSSLARSVEPFWYPQLKYLTTGSYSNKTLQKTHGFDILNMCFKHVLQFLLVQKE